MTLLSERENAHRSGGCQASSAAPAHRHHHHSIALQWSGLRAGHLTPTVREVSWPGLALLALLTGAGALVIDRLGRANPSFMGAMLVSMAVTMAGLHLSAVPQAVVDAGAACDRCRRAWACAWRGISPAPAPRGWLRWP